MASIQHRMDGMQSTLKRNHFDGLQEENMDVKVLKTELSKRTPLKTIDTQDDGEKQMYTDVLNVKVTSVQDRMVAPAFATPPRLMDTRSIQHLDRMRPHSAPAKTKSFTRLPMKPAKQPVTVYFDSQNYESQGLPDKTMGIDDTSDVNKENIDPNGSMNAVLSPLD